MQDDIIWDKLTLLQVKTFCLFTWQLSEPHKTWFAYCKYISMVPCQKGPTRHAYAWQIGPFGQDTIDM